MSLLRLALLLMATILFSLPVSAECDHTWVEKRQEPTCELGGMTWSECSLCGWCINSVYIPPLGHEFGEWYVLEEPTCNRDGTQARDCVRCGHRDESPIPHTGHVYIVEVIAPTCTARGYTSHYCPGCGDRFRTDYTDPLGHRYDNGVVTRDPTFTAMGRILYTCTGCGDTYQETIPVLSDPFEDLNKDAYYYTPVLWALGRSLITGVDSTHFDPLGLCSRAQMAVLLWRLVRRPEPASTENPFSDVRSGSFYETAVLWAYHAGIINGVDNAHFGPEEPCMRAQMVTLLHRFRGSPDASGAVPFSDVPPGCYYYDAVQWAVQRGITNGMGDGTFAPGRLCDRAQIVTFLYRDVKNP